MPAWRDSYKPARFFVLDARIILILLPTLIHIRLYTVIPTILIGIVLWYVEKRLEMDISSAARGLRSFLVGEKRPAFSLMKTRYMVDYDRRDR
jgi:intracellular multiplication protein IcmT